MYHYTDCGLNNVWLKNGYETYDTDYGEAVGIHDVEGLHKAIGLHLIANKPRLTGAEVRFLRIELDLSQKGLANLLGVTEQSVRGWEKHRNTITKAPERLLRFLYRESVCNNGMLRKLVDRIATLNRDAYHAKIELEETDAGWKQAA